MIKRGTSSQLSFKPSGYIIEVNCNYLKGKGKDLRSRMFKDHSGGAYSPPPIGLFMWEADIGTAEM